MGLCVEGKTALAIRAGSGIGETVARFTNEGAKVMGRPGTASDVEGVMGFPRVDSVYATGGIFTLDGGLTAL